MDETARILPPRGARPAARRPAGSGGGRPPRAGWESSGLQTIDDLLGHAPRRYESAAPERRIADLLAEEEVAIAGVVQDVTVRRPRRRLAIVKARIHDDSGDINAIWFNQEWLATKLVPGTPIRLRGRLQRGEFQVRAYDLGDALATADYAPGLSRRRGADAAAAACARRPGASARTRRARSAAGRLGPRLELPIKGDALHAMHRPRSLDEAAAARRRLALEELLVLQVGLARRRREREDDVARALPPPGELVGPAGGAAVPPDRRPGAGYPELDADLERAVPMERLLQGDVGSGKTVVALYALLRAVEAGFRGALMAPTETLAEQHFLTLESFCTQLGVTCGLLTSSAGKREREQAAGAAVVVGTHALIQAGVDLGQLAVAVVDEQHRFGVEQRKALSAGTRPHRST